MSQFTPFVISEHLGCFSFAADMNRSCENFYTQLLDNIGKFLSGVGIVEPPPKS